MDAVPSVPAVNPAPTASPAAETAAPAAPSAPKVKFEKFSNLDDSPGNKYDEAPKEARVEGRASDDVTAVPEKEEAPKKEADAPKKEAKAESPVAKTKHKVKVDGEEAEIDYEELLAGYQRAAASTRRSQEAAQARREAENLKIQLDQALQNLTQRDPIQAAKLLGFTEQQIQAAIQAESQRQLEYAKLSPKDRQILELQQAQQQAQSQAAEYQRQMQEFQAQQQQIAEQARLQQEQAQYAEQIDREFPVVMEKYGLGKNPATAAFMTRVMLEQHDAGNTAFTLDDAAAVTREWIESNTKRIFTEDLPIETLRQYVPEALLTKLRQAAIAPPQQATAQVKPASAPNKKPGPKKPITSFAKEYEEDSWAAEFPDPIRSQYDR